MDKKTILMLIITPILFFAIIGGVRYVQYGAIMENGEVDLMATAKNLISMEPPEVKTLRTKDLVTSEPGRQEYYFSQLDEDEQRAYREILAGVRAWEESFYITIADDAKVDRSYHAVYKDHPELFWIHNRNPVYKTTYSGQDYCLFSPGYLYDGPEGETTRAIEASMEAALMNVKALLPVDPTDYEIAKTVYTYLIDHTAYEESDEDQSVAGVFAKARAVCAGYAGAAQYLLESLGVPCIYVEGTTSLSEEGHAWNIITLDGQNYYMDTTNGDQPDFLEGDAAVLEEHKTILMDYLCPFPEEYESVYTASPEFPVPACSARDKNFYVLNDGCFSVYDPDALEQYFRMRIGNGAAVVRFKFSEQEAYDECMANWLDSTPFRSAVQFYMETYGMGEITYSYGVLDTYKTFYFMF